MTTFEEFKETNRKVKIKSEINERWATRVIPKGFHLMGREGAVEYLNQYGKGISTAKVVQFALKAEAENCSEMAVAFWEKAFEHETGVAPTKPKSNIIKIGEYTGAKYKAFCRSQKIEPEVNMELEEGVTVIPTRAFTVTALPTGDDYDSIDNWNDTTERKNHFETLKIPSTVVEIEERAFYRCRMLKTITWPSQVKTIKRRMFIGCEALESIIIPEGVERIENEVFFGCENLTEVLLPDSLLEIGNDVFSGCHSLMKVTIGRNLEKIAGNFITRNLPEIILDPSNPHLEMVNGWLVTKKGELIRATNLIDAKFGLPGNLTKIANGALAKTPFDKLTIPRSVTVIGYENLGSIGSLRISESLYQAIVADQPGPLIGVLTVIVYDDSDETIAKFYFGGTTYFSSSVRIVYKCLDSYKFDAALVYPDPLIPALDKAKASLYRLQYPYLLDDETRAAAVNFVKRNKKGLIEYLIESKEYDSFRFALNYLATRFNVEELIEQVSKTGDALLIAALLEHKNNKFPNINKRDEDLGFSLEPEKKSPAHEFHQLWSLTDRGESLRAYKGKEKRITLPTEFRDTSITSIKRHCDFGDAEEIIIPEGYTSLDERSFASNYNDNQYNGKVRHVSLPSSLRYVGLYAFYGNTSLKTAEINVNPRSDYRGLFDDCDLQVVELTNKFDETETLFGTSHYHWSDHGKRPTMQISAEKIILRAGKFALPQRYSDIKTIEVCADVVLERSEGIPHVDKIIIDPAHPLYAVDAPFLIDRSGTTIFATINSQKIETYEVPKGVTVIPNKAFSGTIIKKLIIGENVTTIGDEAFSNAMIGELCLPHGIQIISKNAFSESNIKTLILPDSIEQYGSLSFWRATLGELRLPAGIVEIPERAFMDFTYSGSLEIPDGCVQIGEGSFQRSKITEIKLPSSLRTLGKDCFKEAIIESIDLPQGIESISNQCFEKTTISRICLPKSLKHLGEGAFNQTKLKDITIPDQIDQIPDSCFADCGLDQITLPNTISVIGRHAFSNCRFTKFDLPDSVVKIGDRAFSSNPLEKFHITKNVENIGNSFLSGTKVESITVDPENQFFAAVDGVLFSKDLTTLVRYPPLKCNAEYAFPDELKTIIASALEEIATPVVFTFPNGEVAFKEENNYWGRIDTNAFPQITICAPSGSTLNEFARVNGIKRKAYRANK